MRFQWFAEELEDVLCPALHWWLAGCGRISSKSLSNQTPWGEAVAALSRTDDEWSPDGLARLRALIVRRHVRVDINRRITQQTPVVLTESAAIQLGK
jgi:hypothetical protein